MLLNCPCNNNWLRLRKASYRHKETKGCAGWGVGVHASEHLSEIWHSIHIGTFTLPEVWILLFPSRSTLYKLLGMRNTAKCVPLIEPEKHSPLKPMEKHMWCFYYLLTKMYLLFLSRVTHRRQRNVRYGLSQFYFKQGMKQIRLERVLLMLWETAIEKRTNADCCTFFFILILSHV